MVQTSALLPAARIDVFSTEQHTQEMIKSLDDDWRFARIILGLQDSDMAGAVKFYETHESPNIIIIQTDDTSESFINSLEGLAAVCSEDTEALIIGPENDIQLYRKLTDLGVSDYLVHPVEKEDMVSSLTKILLARLGTSDSHLISVVGAKGGVGTTCMSQILSTAIAERAKQKMILMDGGGAWSDVSLSMGAEPASNPEEIFKTIERKDEDSLARMIAQVSNKLSVLSSGNGPLFSSGISHSEYEAIIDYMMQHYPYVVMDLSKSENQLKKTILARSHAIFIITTPTLYALRTTRSLIKEYRELVDADSVSKLKIVMNMDGRSVANEISKKDLKSMLDVDVDIIVPYDPKLYLGAEANGTLIRETATGAKLEEEFLSTLSDVFNGGLKFDGGADKKGSFLDKIKTSLKK